MSNSNSKGVFRTTKISLKELVPDPEQQIPILALFDDLDIAKTKATRAGRVYQSAMSEVTLKQNNLLLEVGQHDKRIDQEPMVFAYKKGEDIIFEIPFTERDVRNAIRLQKAQMNQALTTLENGGKDDLYGDESEGEGNQG